VHHGLHYTAVLMHTCTHIHMHTHNTHTHAHTFSHHMQDSSYEEVGSLSSDGSES